MDKKVFIKIKDIDKKPFIGFPIALIGFLYLFLDIMHSTKNFTSFTLDGFIIIDIFLFFFLSYLFYLIFTKKYKKKLISISLALIFSGALILFLSIILFGRDYSEINRKVIFFGNICNGIGTVLFLAGCIKEIIKKKEL